MNKIPRAILRHIGICLLLAVIVLPVGDASAAEFWLKTGTNQLTMPDGEAVTIWGFARDTDGNFTTDDGTPVTSPGPMLSVPPGDNTLTIHLQNNLTAEPVSLTIAGQFTTMTPVFWPMDAKGRQRVRSFTHEADPNGGVASYTWNDFKPGTYLYQSGTHPAIQVQMGLFGGVKKNTAANAAYSGVPFDVEGILILSEIDPAVHEAVAAGTYGTPGGMQSTIEYHPEYFLFNGQAQIVLTGIVPSIVNGQRVLVRLLNAGLITRMPQLIGTTMTIVAEDGNALPYPAENRSAIALLAGKTLDVVATASSGTSMALIDRRGYVSRSADKTLGAAGGLDFPTNQTIDGLAVPPASATMVSSPSSSGGGGGCFISALFH